MKCVCSLIEGHSSNCLARMKTFSYLSHNDLGIGHLILIKEHCLQDKHVNFIFSSTI